MCQEGHTCRLETKKQSKKQAKTQTKIPCMHVCMLLFPAGFWVEGQESKPRFVSNPLRWIQTKTPRPTPTARSSLLVRLLPRTVSVVAGDCNLSPAMDIRSSRASTSPRKAQCSFAVSGQAVMRLNAAPGGLPNAECWYIMYD